MMRAVVFLLVVNYTAFGQSLVQGTIVDKETGKPVPFASIGIVGTSKGTSSNLNGQFSISIVEPVSLKVTCVGYESVVINSLKEITLIQLKPIATQLSAIVVLDKALNPRKIMRKAFSAISINYSDQSFLQKFFYRHYCKDGEEYGRLIEASVDVWKHQGYRSIQKSAGDKEEIRITQLRRSLDKTIMAEGHEPIAVGNILQADVVGYQTTAKSEHLSFHTEVSNLKTDFESYSFTFKGIHHYDNQEVYEISYSYKKDSILTTSGKYLPLTQVNGSLFITTDSYAFIKTEEEKSYGNNIIRSSAYYRKYDDRYYPYHFIREGESKTSDNTAHSFHIELMSLEIKTNVQEKFIGRLPSRDDLLKIPYDSGFWVSHTILKTTPLEDDIISDLGGGASLNKQFLRYHQFEKNTRDGGVNGEEKFNWLLADNNGNRILYLFFWAGNLQSYLADIELAKRLQKKYRKKVTFVFLSLEDDEKKWKETVEKFSLYTDGVINYRIGSHSKIAASLAINEVPSFILISRNGERIHPAKKPSDPLLEDDFMYLLKDN
jgi:hypothetical protein